MTDETRKTHLTRQQWSLLFLIMAVAGGSVAYRLIVYRRLEQTSLMFIGVPTILAVWLALTPKTKTVTGGILKGMTIALLIAAPLLGEGFICVVMAAPLFYGVGILVGVTTDSMRKKRGAVSCLLLLLVPMSLEGVTPGLSFDRAEAVQVSQVVQASPEEVRLALAYSPRIGAPLPMFLRLRFPRPTEAQGTGLQIGAQRIIHFAGGEGRPGDLVLRVAESRPGYVRFEAVSDHSKVAHWLAWKSSEVKWNGVNANETQVTWTLHFQRRLDPAWYFGPWERYAAGLAAGYLIETNATPAASLR
jgi:hypothetical protein